MLKKHLISVLLMVLTVLGASAGTWKMHGYFVTSSIQNVFDAGDEVYYLNSGTLFRFDKETKVTTQLGRQNILSDNRISQIYYDWERDLLFVAYLNSNIDVIDGTGKVTNISNLKNMNLPVSTYTVTNGELTTAVSKVINDITFANGIAYVAADYGFLLIDESTLNVIKNYDMGEMVTVYSSGRIGELQYVVSGRYIYRGDSNANDPRNEYIKVGGTFTNAKTIPVSETSFIISMGSSVYHYEFASGSPVTTKLVSAYATSLQKTPTGFIANFQGQSYYYTIDATGKVATQASTTAGLASSHPLGDGTVWICDANGLHKKGSTEYFKMNAMTTNTPHWLRYNGTLDKLYIANSAPNKVSASSSSQANVINTYDGMTWQNATPYTTSGSVGYDFVFNPSDPTTYYRASWNKGLFKVTNDVMVLNYTNTNARIGNYRPYPAFDNYGNLWVVSTYSSTASANPVSVLVSDKVNNTTSVKNDWFVPNGLSALFTKSFQRARFLVSKKNNVKIFSDMDYPRGTVNGHIICWDNENPDALVDNYHYVSIANFIDQNNKQVDWVYLCHFEEDHDGLIWVAHDMGVFILDPVVVFDEHPRVVRPYVTKSSEGKGYLCEGYSVYDVGVDRENNKWLASNDGLYYVSADGSEIYNHFTTENSDIPSNTVYSVECDTIHDRVYIYTDNGFAEYVVNGEAASLNLDNVYAFPNPVEPDFTGMIKIANLMENTYVTITDRNGNIITQMGPVMGSTLWDGSGADGERVATGIYNIYAAQGAQPALTGEPVATVMIIK